MLKTASLYCNRHCSSTHSCQWLKMLLWKAPKVWPIVLWFRYAIERNVLYNRFHCKSLSLCQFKPSKRCVPLPFCINCQPYRILSFINISVEVSNWCNICLNTLPYCEAAVYVLRQHICHVWRFRFNFFW